MHTAGASLVMPKPLGPCSLSKAEASCSSNPLDPIVDAWPYDPRRGSAGKGVVRGGDSGREWRRRLATRLHDERSSSCPTRGAGPASSNATAASPVQGLAPLMRCEPYRRTASITFHAVVPASASVEQG